MKCPECGGVGRIHYGEEWCFACNGTCEVQTNEEWRKTCSAKEFAKWLEGICFREQYNDGESMSGWYEEHDEKYWKKWLKQPHTTD